MTTIRDLVYYLINKKEHYPISDAFIEHYQQSSGGYIEFAKDTGHIVDSQKHEPNQKWHFFESWLLPKILSGKICWNSNADINFYSKIQCPELLLWFLEAAGIASHDVTVAYEIAEKGKKENSHPSKIAKEIRTKITWEAVEKSIQSQS